MHVYIFEECSQVYTVSVIVMTFAFFNLLFCEILNNSITRQLASIQIGCSKMIKDAKIMCPKINKTSKIVCPKTKKNI